ncbi:MAG: hypothetical protein QME74_03900, partial [Candidatus Edwardsbacteria bacterium]|nr:hypothetical protein [Candidatus Edwardsbacteria bacterium]
MLHKQDVHGYQVYFEDDAKYGVEYLDHRIDYREAKVFFETAKNRGAAEFEDGEGRDFTLTYNRGPGNYTVARRKTSSSWF